MIIGILGTADSGKDTVAAHVRKYSFTQIAIADPVKRIAQEVYEFSKEQLWGPSALRNTPDKRYPREHGPWINGRCACCDLLPHGVLVGAQSLPMESTSCYLTPRFALQMLGTDWGRNCFTDTWAYKGISAAHRLLNGGYRYYQEHGTAQDPDAPRAFGVVISDVRFKNEMNFIRTRSFPVRGLLLRVRRSTASPVANATHNSETEQLDIPDDAFDAVIVNDGTLSELYAKVDQFMEAYGCRMYL